MKSFYTLIVLFLAGLFPFMGMAQNRFEDHDTSKDSLVDYKYRDDQFYFGLTYNLVMQKPDDMSLRGLSGGIRGGFLRDMPVNKRRNIAVAIGLGIAYDQYGHNLFIGEDAAGKTIFSIMDSNVTFSQNRFGMALIEVPLEFRWRTSTPTEYSFWRIYGGLRLGYAYWYKATFKQPGNNVNQTDIPEFTPLRFEATLSVGYGTFNFTAAYSLNDLFENAQTQNGIKLNLRTLKVGLMFYIL